MWKEKLIGKLKNKKVTDIAALKSIVDSIANSYAEQLTDYALISGNNSLQNLSEDKKKLYEKQRKYKEISIVLEDEIVKKIDNMLC